MEKLTFALVTAARKLRPYLQAHTIVVHMNHPFQTAMNKPDVVKWLIQWAIKVSEFDIDYRTRMAVKAQALADFIAEFTAKKDEPREEDIQKLPRWTINIDESSTKLVGWVGVILESPDSDLLKHITCLQYPTTKNEVEYKALLVGQWIAKALGEKSLIIHSDS